MELPPWLEAIGDRSVRLRIRLQPRASKNELIVGEHSAGVLRVRVTSPPVNGAANEALVKLIANSLKVGRSRVRLESGFNSRNKAILIEDVEALEVWRQLAPRSASGV